MLRVISVVLLTGWLHSAFALTVTFDDIDASAADVSLDGLSPYQGFTWTDFFAYTTFPGFPGFNNGIVSPENAAYSGGEFFGTTVTPVIGKIQSADAFDFVSAWLGSGYYDGLNLTVQGLLGGTVLFSQAVTVDTGGAQFIAFNYTGIDELNFFGTQTAQTTDPFLCGDFNCTQFTVDDLIFAPASEPPPPPNSVPEPSSLALIALGAFAAGVRRREKRRAA